MAVESPSRSAEDLRDMTRRWLAEHLPAGWMEAVDAGDTATRWRRSAVAWTTQSGASSSARPATRPRPGPPSTAPGLSLSPGDARFVNEVLNHYKVPRPFNIIGIGMGGPTVMAWGTEEMKHRLLRPLACNQEIWCQLFSEPGAGSDVAGLSTRAVRDGDEWVVNGQKVWTTVAQLSKWGMLLCRTNPDVPKHGGLSYFVVDMEQPGVEVRPLVQITGDSEFNEVFFNDARVRHDWMLGREGDGWKVAITTLMNERVSLSGAGSIGGDAVGGSAIDRLLERHRGITDPLARQRLASAYIESRLIRLNNQRAGDKRKSGAEAGPEGSITKLHAGRVQPAAAEARARPRGCGRSRVGRRQSLQDGARRARAAGRRAMRRSRSGSCGPRRTRSRAGPPTSCATSWVSGCSASRRIPTTPASCPGARYPAPADGSASIAVVNPEPRAVPARPWRDARRDRPGRGRRLADPPHHRPVAVRHAGATFSREEVAERSGVDPEVSVRLWRALGFPDVPDGAPGVHRGVRSTVLRTLQERVEAWFMRRETTRQLDAVETLVQQVRALSGGFARVAEALSDSIIDSVRRRARAAGLDDETIAAVCTPRTSSGDLSSQTLRLRVAAADARRGLAQARDRRRLRDPADARGRVPGSRRLHGPEPGARGR